ncbi:hypothetical protein SARC_13075, partial [Sphaeroforma arctica JP610]
MSGGVQQRPTKVPTHTTKSGVTFAKYAGDSTVIGVPHSQRSGTAVFIPEGMSYEA